MLKALLLRSMAQVYYEVIKSQQSFKLEASFSFVCDFKPNPPSFKDLQHLCHATVTRPNEVSDPPFNIFNQGNWPGVDKNTIDNHALNHI